MDNKGIERDFSVTPFNIRVRHWTFYFSSRFNMERFCDDYMDYTEGVKESLFRRFRCHTPSVTLILYLWYQKVERRGFRIVDERTGGVMICPKDVIILGNNLTKANCENSYLDET